MKILYLPLDERPCNYIYPNRIVDLVDSVEMIIPPMDYMGNKKTPGLTDRLWQFTKDKCKEADVAIISIDLLLYGGIVPSRLHHYSEQEITDKLESFKELKKINPNLKIYAFNLITRVPAYSSSEEEPDYYENYGKEIFKYGCLKDKELLGIITEDEKNEFEKLKSSIPNEFLSDFINRRQINEMVNFKVIEMTKAGIIDFLIIPLDDCNPYGLSAITQRKLSKRIKQYELWENVYIYPGADEIGCTLVTRAINKFNNWKPKICLRYSSEIGKTAVPSYEDRPLCENIKSHIAAAGGVIVKSETLADYILMVNTPSNRMTECVCADKFNNDYEKLRNLREFVNETKMYIDEGYKLAIADVAYANGSDPELVKMIINNDIYDKIYGYAGWNTCSNTLGTVIAYSMISVLTNSLNSINHKRFIAERFLEDWAYQAIWRKQIKNQLIPQLGLKITYLLQEVFERLLKENFSRWDEVLKIKNIYMPWNRMFEVGLELEQK